MKAAFTKEVNERWPVAAFLAGVDVDPVYGEAALKLLCDHFGFTRDLPPLRAVEIDYVLE